MGHYGAVVACVDGRWLPRTMELAQQTLGKSMIDLHTRPGSTRRMQNNCPVTDELARNIVFVSLGLHAAQDILVVKHWDCGDHGGSHSFSSPEEELETYIGDLRRVRSVLPVKLSDAVAEIMAVEPPPTVAKNLQSLLERGLQIRYAVLTPRDLRAPSLQPEDYYPLVFE